MARPDYVGSTFQQAEWPVDLAEFETYRRLAPNEGDPDELEKAIAAGCGFVESQTGLHLRRSLVEAIFTNTDGRLWLPAPVLSPDGPWWDTVEVFVRGGIRDAWAPASETDWDLFSGQPWTLSASRAGQYQVGYVRGYDAPGDVPAELVDLCFKVAGAFYENREAAKDSAFVPRAAFALAVELKQFRDLR